MKNSQKKKNNELVESSELSSKESELYDLFIDEYNDLFENLFNLKGKNIFSILKHNVSLLIGKKKFHKYTNISLEKIQKMLKDDYLEPDTIVINNLGNNFDNINFKECSFLDIDLIFAHCEKCYECLHICGEPLYNLNYYGLIICKKCKMIYKKNMIRLYCKSCKEEYFSYIVEETNIKKDYIPATWKKYHCFSFNYEQMRCPICISPLYYSDEKKILKCFDCKWVGKPSKIKWLCEKCGNYFTSDVKEFIKYENKPEINCIKNAFINKTKAIPVNCNCCDSNNKLFLHFNCGGKLYISYLQRQLVVVCKNCKLILKPNDVKMICSNCSAFFNCNQIIGLKKKKK